MTSDRMIAANRQNARRSRGPRTAAGRQRSSRNALRHGLAASGFVDPAWGAEVEALAHAIAGKGADPQRLAAARLIADAQCELDRIQSIKSHYLNIQIAIAQREAELDSEDDAKTEAEGRSESQSEADTASANEGADNLARLGLDVFERLVAMGRYEHRALARRRNAMRAFSFFNTAV